MRNGMIILAGFLSLVIITLLTTIYITGKASANSEPRLSYTTLVVEHVTGVHGDVWKYMDGNRECYFTTAGGIWCTP